MSAIGEYVHLLAENYIEYGVSRIDRGHKVVTAVSMMNMKRQQVQNKIRQNTHQGNIQGAKKLETKLNNFLDYIEVANQDDHSGANKIIIENAIMKMLTEQYGDTLGKVNMSQANVESTMRGKKIGTISSPYHYAKRGDSYQSTVVQRIQELRDAIKKVQTDVGYLPTKKDGTGGRTAEQITKDLDYIENLLKNIKKGVLNKLTKDAPADTLKGLRITGDEKQLISEINDLITIYANIQPVADQKGMLLEMLTSLIPYNVMKIGQEYSQRAFIEGLSSATRILNKNQVGKDLALVRYGVDFFQKDMWTKGKGYDTDEQVIQLKNIVETIHTSEQKIDVKIEVKGVDPDLQGMTISAKNYNLGADKWSGKRLSVSTQNSLLHLLQDENDNDFVNHWLNVVASHEKQGSKSAGPQRKINAMRPIYNNAIKYIVFYKALTGDVYGRNSTIPEFLVVNNNQSGIGVDHVKVIPVKELLNKAMENFDKNSRNQGFYVKLTPDLFNTNVTLKNDRVPVNKEGTNAEYVRWGTTRIATLLVHLHQVKIHAGINTSLLNLAHMASMKI